MQPFAVSRRGSLVALLGGLVTASATRVDAQTAPTQRVAIEHQLFPGRTYDPRVPGPTAALGYALGKDLATYAEMVPYFERLAATSRRVKFATHGESYEGRPLYDITISSPENLARLTQIKANLARLADPRKLTGPQDAEAIVRGTPVVLLLVFATDGAETAGPEAAIQLAYQLAAGTDARTQSMLRDAVIVIVPAENPDANQRAVAWYNAFRVGRDGTADPDAAEHQFPWGINSNNHYQIDPNRESVWNILRESQAMVALYRQWNPQVYVDNHGEYATYTGPWYVEPLHEVLTARQREWHHQFGEAMQAEFKNRNYEYAPWEYGQFDPGYWDTYPNFSGSIAWTTETSGGGSRGLRVERRGGAPHTLADGIIQHVVAADVTIDVAVKNRERLLRDFLEYKRSAITEGERGAVKAYAISAQNDPQSLAAVIGILRRNAIEVHRTTRALPVTGARRYTVANAAPAAVTLPAGSYVISTAQPESRMLRVLMEPEAKFSTDFMAQVTKAQADTGRSAGRLFYDITAWSIPHTYNLEAYELFEPVTTDALAKVTTDEKPRGELAVRNASRTFFVDYSSNLAIHAIARLRRDSINYRIWDGPVTISGRLLSSGSILFSDRDNPSRDLNAIARSMVEDGVTVLGVAGPYNDGVGPGVERARVIRPNTGRIAVIMDRPVSPASFGHVWFTFEEIYGIEFTALNFDRLSSVNLDKYTTIILPDGNYNSVHKAVSADIATRLRAWVEKGGTLIGMRGASAWIASEEAGLTAARMKKAPPRLPAVPGAIFRATITDPRSQLVFGYGNADVPVMVWSALAFDPTAPVEAPLRIADAASARVSGFAFTQSLAHLSGSPYVVRDKRGQGSVVLFLDDPNFRLFWDGLTRLFFNAVLLSNNATN